MRRRASSSRSSASPISAVSVPATVGQVLRTESLAPAGATLPLAPAPAPRLPEPEPAAAPPAVRTLSYSTLSNWQACGYRFYLQRVLGLEDEAADADGQAEVAPGIDARTRGSLVHALLEREDDDPVKI